MLYRRYYIPEVTAVFPFSKHSHIEGAFAGYGKYCDKVSYHKYGVCRAYADSIGVLTLPDGTKIPDVLQVHHERRYKIVPQRASVTKLVSKLSADSIGILMSDTSGIIHEHEIQLFAYGYRYPLVEDITISNSQNPQLRQVTYFCSPYEQDRLPLDSDNTQIQRGRCNMNDVSAYEVEDKSNQVFSFVDNHASSSEVIFRFGDYIRNTGATGNSSCRIVLSDNRGMVVRSTEMTESPVCNEYVKLSYSGLHRGQYLLGITVNGGIYTNNFIVE